MRKLAFLIFGVVFLTSSIPSHAQNLFPEKSQSGSAVVKASVGQFYLNITAYQSPNASVVIQTLSELFLSSTTADDAGYFSFADVLITDDFPGFCFTAIDFRRVGESRSCVEIEEVVTEDQSYNDIFLPPTIGLSRKQITVGEDAQIFGYSMPYAKVDISFDEETVTLQADESGYYEYLFDNPPAGTYAFSSRGTLGESISLEPKNQAILEVRTIPEKIEDDLTGFAQDIEEKFPGALFLFPLLIILISLLIALIWKTKPKFIYAFFDKFKKRHPMHHDYFLFEQ